MKSLGILEELRYHVKHIHGLAVVDSDTLESLHERHGAAHERHEHEHEHLRRLTEEAVRT